MKPTHMTAERAVHALGDVVILSEGQDSGQGHPGYFRRYSDTWTLIAEKGDWALYERVGNGRHLTLGRWRARKVFGKISLTFTGFSDRLHGYKAWTYGPCGNPKWRAIYLERALKKMRELK